MAPLCAILKCCPPSRARNCPCGTCALISLSRLALAFPFARIASEAFHNVKSPSHGVGTSRARIVQRRWHWSRSAIPPSGPAPQLAYLRSSPRTCMSWSALTAAVVALRPVAGVRASSASVHARTQRASPRYHMRHAPPFVVGDRWHCTHGICRRSTQDLFAAGAHQEQYALSSSHACAMCSCARVYANSAACRIPATRLFRGSPLCDPHGPHPRARGCLP
jgi:hypothetical protein